MNLALVILITIAAALNAFMDIVENENFYTSRFVNCNPNFWYKRESWKYARKVFGWKFDAWHVAKSLMLFALIGAIAQSWFEWVCLGLLWNVVFRVSYKFFKKDI